MYKPTHKRYWQCLKLTKDRYLNSGMFKKLLQIKILKEKN